MGWTGVEGVADGNGEGRGEGWGVEKGKWQRRCTVVLEKCHFCVLLHFSGLDTHSAGYSDIRTFSVHFIISSGPFL